MQLFCEFVEVIFCFLRHDLGLLVGVQTVLAYDGQLLVLQTHLLFKVHFQRWVDSKNLFEFLNLEPGCVLGHGQPLGVVHEKALRTSSLLVRQVRLVVST